MKKKVTASVESRFRTAKWRTVVSPFTNLHIVKKDLLRYLEHEASGTLGSMAGPSPLLLPLQLRLIVEGRAWSLPDFKLENLYGTHLNDMVDALFRDMERIMDLHEAFYGD